MSRLTVYADDAPGNAIVRTEDVAAIAENLAPLGVRFERRESPVALSPDDAPETILATYWPYLDGLMGASGAGSADVVKMRPDFPNIPAIRAKFLSERTHSEDEVRLFVSGAGNFILHVDGKIFDVHFTEGDLISVPARTKPWVDAGLEPNFTALRVFRDTSGWVPHYTGKATSAALPAS